MGDSLDKTRPEFEGIRSFVGTGVGTFPDILEEQKDLRQMMQEMINEAMSTVVGATVIQDVPDQIEYNFFGGGITRNELNEVLGDVYDTIYAAYQHLWDHLSTAMNLMFNRVNDLQQQINDLQSGTGSGVACSAYLSSHQNDIVNTTETVIELDAAVTDAFSMFDSTSHRITIPITGTYLVTASIRWFCSVKTDPALPVETYQMWVRKNGSASLLYELLYPSFAKQYYQRASEYANFVEGDYLELAGFHTAGDNTPDILGNPSYTFLTVQLVKRTSQE